MNKELIESLSLPASEMMKGVIVSAIVIIAYMVILFIGSKYQKVDCIQKIANILAAFAVWIELLFGDMYELFGNYDLTYFLIAGTLITLINTMWSK